MQTSYVKKSDTVQKASDYAAESIVDSSLQNTVLQRHAALTKMVTQRAPEPRPNLTGMPDNLKRGIESLSGFSMDDVRVHYNSSKPATVQALAYTQGTDIHVAPGQEHTLPHEAWHVAQQMAGRVSPTTNINGMPVNDNAGLEHEADVMGEKATKQRKLSEFETFCKPISNDVSQMRFSKKGKGTNDNSNRNSRKPKKNGSHKSKCVFWFSVLRGRKKIALSRRTKKNENLPSVFFVEKLGAYKNVNEYNERKKTSIEYFPKSVSYKSFKNENITRQEIVGSRMQAYLNPYDPIKGSTPGAEQNDLMKSIKAKQNGHDYVKGHLLNDNLGGLGCAYNLAPLSKSANGLHEKKVESYVKCLLGNDFDVKYCVNVEIDKEFNVEKPNVCFLCNVEYKDGNTWFNALDTKICSFANGEGSFGENITDKVRHMKDSDKKTGSVDNLEKKGWGSSGRGNSKKNKKTKEQSHLFGVNVEEYSHGKLLKQIDGIRNQEVLAEIFFEKNLNELNSKYPKWRDMAREISKFDVRAVKLFCDNVIENAIGLNPNSIVKIMLDEQMDSLRIVHSREGDMARDRSVFDAYELKLFCDDVVENAIGLEPNVIVEILAIMADENELMGEGE